MNPPLIIGKLYKSRPHYPRDAEFSIVDNLNGSWQYRRAPVGTIAGISVPPNEAILLIDTVDSGPYEVGIGIYNDSFAYMPST